MANVHVNLLFEANTQNAINNINQLGQLLNQIGSKKIGVDSGPIQQAANAARELQVHLDNAVNVNTGKLDLTKLNTSLKQSNQSLSQLSGQLVAAGITGQQAFVKLANSIASAQVPAFTLGRTIGAMMKTVGTAAMWTVAYGAIDAITKTFTGAIDYTKDLNKALTDIAIVSKLTEKQLADFAQTASKTAKDLKTTTTAYAEAALIFYQQGLRGSQVEERTNAVIKMMHVTGESAKTVSDQMTAVWNNFADGSRSLEYYIDVLTALGAATASSTDEITQGLEKFAAIANTVGLSYEYAATALATVTAQTRQSADVVGTAFKTLFARIQDLELGETLEDGVTLGSYSQALAKIGVSALDANGNLREMDDILDDMGAKWNTLTKAQQTATAQSVAGVRQYTQLIALMDNWDTFKINLEVAEDAEGTLEKQHEVWAKSAEAAGEKIKQAWNDTYEEILDEETVIGFMNVFAGLIHTVGDFIDSMGGIIPMVITIAALFANKLLPPMLAFFTTGISNFFRLTLHAQSYTAATRSQTAADIDLVVKNKLVSEEYAKQLTLSKELLTYKNALEKATKNLSAAEKENINLRLQMIEGLMLEAQNHLEAAEAAKRKRQSIMESTNEGVMRSDITEAGLNYAGKQVIESDAYKAANAEIEKQKALKKEINIEIIKQNNLRKEGKISEEEANQKIKEQEELEKKANNVIKEQLKIKRQLLQEQNQINQVSAGNNQATIMGRATVQHRSAEKQGLKGTSADVYNQVTKGYLGAGNNNLTSEVSFQSVESVASSVINLKEHLNQAKTAIMELETIEAQASQQGPISQQEIDMIKAEVDAEMDLVRARQQVAQAKASGDESQIAAATAAEANAQTNLNAVLEKNSGAYKKMSPERQQVIQLIKGEQVSLKTLAQQYNISEDKLKGLKLEGKSFSDILIHLKENFTNFKGGLQGGSAEMEGLLKKMLNLKGLSPEVKTQLEALVAALEKEKSESNAAAQAQAVLNDQMKKTMAAAQSASSIIAGFGGALVKTLGQIQMIFSGIQMLKSAFNSFNSEDGDWVTGLTTGLMGLTMILPIVTTGISGLITSMVANNNLKAYGIKLTQKEIWAGMAKSAIDDLETKGVNKNTAAEWANVAAKAARFWYISLIIAVLAALTAMIVWLIKNQEKEKTALEKATEAYQANQAAVENLTKALEDNNQKLEDTISLLDEIQQVQDSFTGLVEGSTAWNENLTESQKLLNELLEQYPELLNLQKNGQNVIDMSASGMYQILDMEAIRYYVQSVLTLQNLNLQLAKSLVTYSAKQSDFDVQRETAKEKYTTIESLENIALQTYSLASWSNDTTSTIASMGSINTGILQEEIIKQLLIQAAKNNGEFSDSLDWVSEIRVSDFNGGTRELTAEEIEAAKEMVGYAKNGLQAIQGFDSYVNNYAKIVEEEEDIAQKRLEYEKQHLEQLKVLSSQVLTKVQDFQLLSDSQQILATEALAYKLAEFEKDSEFVGASESTAPSEELLMKVLQGAGYNGGEARAEATRMNNRKGDNKGNYDFGDTYWNDETGRQLLQDYMHAQGIDMSLATLQNQKGFEVNHTGITTDVEGLTINWDDVTTYYLTKLQEGIYTEIPGIVAAYSEATSALATGTIENLSPEALRQAGAQFDKEGNILNPNALLSSDLVDSAIKTRVELLGIDEEQARKDTLEYLSQYSTKLYEITQLEKDRAAGNSYIATMSQQYKLDAEAITNYAKTLYAANKALGMTYEKAAKVAVAQAKVTKGLEELRSGWEEAAEQMSKYTEGSYEWVEAATEVAKHLTSIFGIEVNTNFVNKYKKEIEDLVEGGEKAAAAYDKLALAVSQDFVSSLGLDESTTELWQSELAKLAEQASHLQLGDEIEISPAFIASLEQMVKAGKITKEEVESLLGGISVAPTIDITSTDYEANATYSWSGTAEGSINDDPRSLDYTADGTWTKMASEGTVTGIGINAKATVTGSNKTLSITKPKKPSGKGGSKKEKKKYDDEIERYHKITAELGDLERQLDAIAEAKDRAFGPDKLAYMDQEIAKQRELAEAQERYLSEIEANLKSDASYMLGYGAILDEEGRITNYDELMQSKIDAYNSGEMSEEAYDQFVKDLEQYEETLGLLKDEQQEFINLQNTIIDLGLEKVQYEVEFKVSIEEDSLALIEFMMDNLTDGVADAADAIGYFGQQAESAFKNMDTYAQAVRDVFSVKDVNGEAQFSEEQINALLSNDPEAIAAALEGETLTEAQIEALREYRDAMMDEYKNAQEASIGIIETLGSAFEDAQKPFADAAAEMEHLTSVTQAYVDVIELVGAERLGVDKKLLTAAAKTQTALAQQQLTNSKNQLEQSKQMLADYRVAYEQALASGDAKVIEAAKEQLENMEATVKENEQAMLSDLSAALEAAATEFEKAMEEIASSFEDAMTGAYGSFAALEASFEQQKALADRYLDDYQKIYELSKLNRDIINSIDDNDSIRAKERLRDIQEEINKLQESNVEMTQYEVDELRAKYELRLAEIALEEAQNAKSQVRMARDSEGNWSYVYTADEEAVGTAEQNYEDKLYAYQELAQNRTDELLEQMISIPREFAEAIQEIYQDQTLNDEERRLRIKETEEYYQEMYSFVVSQLRVVNADAAELYTQDWKRYSEMTGYKISLDGNWIDSFEETVVAQLTGYSTLAEAEQGFLTSSQGMLTSLSGAYQTYQTTTKATLNSALGDLAGFLGDESTEGSLAYYLAQAKDKAQEVTNSAAAIGTAHAEAFSTAATAASTQLGAYQTQMANWKKENGLLIESINKVISTYANTKSAQDGINGIGDALKGLEGAARAVESAANAAAKALQNMYNTSPNTGNAPKNITIFGEDSDPAINSLKGQQTVTVSDIKGYVPSGAAAVKGKSLVTLVMKDGKTNTVWTNTSNLQYLSVTTLPNQTRTVSGGGYGLSGGGGGYTAYDPAILPFDTGGYTGSWDSSGRLAMLHQKELVLNAEDTVNFLDAVNIVREIAQAIDLSAVAQAMQMGNLQAAQATSTAQTLEQQVSIHAEFPNATNHSEIEEAFRNLTLTASQFANRKN